MNAGRVGLALIGASVLLAGAGEARAQGLADYDYENLAFRGVGVHFGHIWPSKVAATSIYGLRLDLGYLGPGVRIAPTVSFWSSRMKRSELDRFAEQINQLPRLRDRPAEEQLTGSDLGDIEWSDLAVGLEGHFVWLAPHNLLPYVGAGLGVHALNGRGDAIDGTFVEDLLDSFASGLTGIAGLEYMASERFRIYAEARYTLLSDIHYPGLSLGGAFMLPGRRGEVVGSADERGPGPYRGR